MDKEQRQVKFEGKTPTWWWIMVWIVLLLLLFRIEKQLKSELGAFEDKGLPQ